MIIRTKKDENIISIKRAISAVSSVGGELIDTGNGLILIKDKEYYSLSYKVLDDKITFLRKIKKIFGKLPADRV